MEARWLDAGVRKLPWWEKAANDEQLIEPSDAEDAVDYRGDPLPCSADTRIDLNHAATLVCEATGVPLAYLRGRSRAADVANARRVFAVIAVDYLEHSVADVAQLLRKHPGSVSRWLETPRAAVTQPELVSRILKLVTDFDSTNGTL